MVAPAPYPCLSAEAVASYASGSLSDRELEAIEEHIDGCSLCRQLVSNAAEVALSVERDVTFDPEEGVPTRGSDGERPAPDRWLAEGTRVSRYVVGAPLGAGGMGVVYEAEDSGLGRRVALKVLRAEIFGRDRAAEEVLRREAMAMARLAHPNVVGVYDLFTSGGTTFVVMELVRGTTLREWLTPGPRAAREVLDAFVQAGRGLAAAHEQGVVHRDFKPENVLRDHGGHVWVSDFGLARTLEAQEAHAPGGAADGMTGVAGTPRYMAPEQREGRRATAQTDQFSFCVALHEALFGELPEGAGRDDGSRARARWPAASGRVSPRVRRAIAKGLSPAPGARHASMRGLLDELTHDPTVRRRWLATSAAALACAVALGVTGRRHAATAPTAVCKGGEERLAGVWDGPRRGEVERAFLASGKSFAADAWRGVSAALDTYAQGWVAARTEACEATRVSGVQSEQLLDLRVACLDERLRDLSALTGVLAKADGQVVTKAFGAAEGLAPLASCADAHALTARVRPPSDAAARARVAAVSNRVATGQALRSAGKYDEAMATTEGLVDEATATGYRPVEAEALYLTGRLQYVKGRWEDAERNLRRAAVAADASADDLLRTHVLGELAHFLAEQARFEDVPAVSDQAFAALARLGRNELAEADLLEALSIADNAEGNYEEARRKLARVLDIETQLYGERSWHVGLALADLSDTYPGSAQEGLDLAQRALVIEEDQLGAEHPLVADVELAIGCGLYEGARAAEAEPHMRRALALGESGYGPEHPELPWYLDNLGQALLDQGKLGEARALFERSLAISAKSLKPDHPRLLDPLVGLGECHAREGRPALAVPLFERALALPRKGGSTPATVAEAQLDLAEALDALRPHDARARSLARQAEATLREKADGPRDSQVLARATAWVANHAR